MKVLVAGPSGVIGCPTVRRLIEAGHEVLGLARSERGEAIVRSLGATPVGGDVLDAESVRRAARGVEAVVHLAIALPTGHKQSRQAWEEHDRARLEGSRNLVAAARAAGAQVYVQESILLVYGDQGERWVTEEDEPPRQALTASALEAEQLALAANDDRLATVVLRFGTVYGRDSWHTQLLVSLARKRQLPILGDGQGYWSLVHAEDAAQAVVRAMEDGPGGAVYNVSDDEPVRMADFVRYLADRLGAAAPHKIPLLAARVVAGKDAVTILSSSIRLSNRLLREELGFEPRYPSYREGLDAVLAEPLEEPA
jgi:2-alkyl-3-oxoalkanoate reductase